MIKTPMAVIQEYNKNAYSVCFQFCLLQEVGLIFIIIIIVIIIIIIIQVKRVILKILKVNTKTDFFLFLKTVSC